MNIEKYIENKNGFIEYKEVQYPKVLDCILDIGKYKTAHKLIVDLDRNIETFFKAQIENII